MSKPIDPLGAIVLVAAVLVVAVCVYYDAWRAAQPHDAEATDDPIPTIRTSNEHSRVRAMIPGCGDVVVTDHRPYRVEADDLASSSDDEEPIYLRRGKTMTIYSDDFHVYVYAEER
jgi:hypothetical protein